MPVETVLAVVLVVTLACNAVLGTAIVVARRRRVDEDSASGRPLIRSDEHAQPSSAGRHGTARPGGEAEPSRQGAPNPADEEAAAAVDVRDDEGAADAVRVPLEPRPIVLPRDDVDALMGGDPRSLKRLPRGLADALTGLAGPAAWDDYLRDEGSRVTRYARPVAVVVAELPGMRRLEERLGREQAERVIPAMAAVFRREARSCDRVARLGETRFGVLLPETTEEQAANYVERVRAAADRWLEDASISARLSIGIAGPGPSGRLDVALRTAESRMYAQARRSHQPPND